MITNNNTGRNASNISIALTEYNIEHLSSPPSEAGSNYTTVINGADNRSFIQGQWVAEMLAVGMNAKDGNNQPWVSNMNLWSIKEGDCNNGFGYFSSCSTHVDRKRPSYYHFSMIANNFKGTFLPNLYTTNATSHKAFGYKNTNLNEIGVLIMNMDEQQSVPKGTDNTTISVGIRTNNSDPVAGTIKVKLDGSVSSIDYTCNITRETTMLIVFDINTGAVKRQEIYNLGQALTTPDKLITNATDYNNHSDIVHSSITITPGTSITATSNKVFRATNKISLNSTFSSGSQTLKLTTAPICQ